VRPASGLYCEGRRRRPEELSERVTDPDPATPASIRLEARIARLGTTSTTTEIDVVRDGEVLVEGRLRHVFLDPKTWQKTEIPDWVREGLTPYLAAS
jgi:hypothetical protein